MIRLWKTLHLLKQSLFIRRTVEPTEMNQEGINSGLMNSKVDAYCEAEAMDAEDLLFILYTSGSTGKPKGMVHTTGGYMVGSTYTFKNVFQCKKDDVYWCTADIGWITGHSYIIYGPLCAGATTMMFEGVPSYPDYGRFWEIVDKLKCDSFLYCSNGH